MMRALAVALLLTLTGTAMADESTPSPSGSMHLNATDDVPFPAGTYALTSWASYVPPIRYSSDHVVDGSIGIGYYFWNNHSLNLVASGMHVDQLDDHTAEGTSLSIIGRYHFFNHDPVTAYLDGGVGYCWFNSAVPERGTTYDFNPRIGLGLGWRISDETWLTAGARYFHISNARAHGPEKNPGYDGIECYVGVIITLN